MAIPSLKTLSAFFPYVETHVLMNLRDAMRRGDSLVKIDHILDNFGVEVIRDIHGDVVAYYSNAGDTYATTVMLVNGFYRVTTLGDFVETWERGKRVKLA